MTKKIFIAGAGGIGEAAALLLREWTEFEIEIYLGDISGESLQRAQSFVTQNSAKTSKIATVLLSLEGANEAMKSLAAKNYATQEDRDAHIVTGVQSLPVATGLWALSALLGLLTLAWWREGR